uniref:Uncharacterized protein n=1 Tax=Rhodocyclus tenuis TaxID=1066 RepID=A0A840G2S2_RHOTE|nr:hypothetical protein [Rhodocyclus tenuis]
MARVSFFMILSSYPPSYPIRPARGQGGKLCPRSRHARAGAYTPRKREQGTPLTCIPHPRPGFITKTRKGGTPPLSKLPHEKKSLSGRSRAIDRLEILPPLPGSHCPPISTNPARQQRKQTCPPHPIRDGFQGFRLSYPSFLTGTTGTTGTLQANPCHCWAWPVKLCLCHWDNTGTRWDTRYQEGAERRTDQP